MKINKLIWISLFLTLSASMFAQQVIDARGAGMAFSNAADTRGLEQVGANPATLALRHAFNFEFNLLSGSVGLSNNGLSKGLYNQYFTTGDSLSSSDKSNILNSIPNSGLQGNFSAKLNTFALYMPKFSLSLTGMGNGYFNLPREIAEIGLYGNADLGRTYDFSSAAGTGWGGAALSLGLGFPVKFLRGGMFDFAAIGMTAKYIIGLQYAEVTSAEGYFQNLSADNPTTDFNGMLEMRQASGGSGFGYDIGLVMQSNQKLTISAAVLNAFGSVNWQSGTEIHQYSVKADNFAINSNTFDDDNDSVLVSEDTSFVTGSFSTRLPAVLDFGVSYRLTKKLMFSSEFEQGLSSSMGVLKYSRFAIGSEFTGVPLLPLRAGISFGGQQGFSTAFGVGLNLKYWFVDLGFVNHGGFSGSNTRGYTLAATTRFRF